MNDSSPGTSFICCDLTSDLQMTSLQTVLDTLRATLLSYFVLPALYLIERSTTRFVRALAGSLHDWDSPHLLPKIPLSTNPKTWLQPRLLVVSWGDGTAIVCALLGILWPLE